MTTRSLDRLLTRLEQCRYRFGTGDGTRVVRLLSQLSRQYFADVPSLIRFHEALLFLRAFPHGSRVVRKSEKLLRSFAQRVEQLQQAGADMAQFDPLEVSGIAGSSMEDALSFNVVRWLVRRLPGKVEVVWKDYDEERVLADIWPRFMPLLEEDGYVEANVPWRRWLATASRNKNAEWLVRRFEQLPVPETGKSQLYDALRLPLRWKLNNLPLSRTRNWKRVRRVFYHHRPLITRSEVSLAQELAQPPPELTRLRRVQGEAVLDTVREVMLVRYRELYGTTLGDPATVVRADVGRGVSIYLWGLPAARRLPLRFYVAGFTLKNGVPINYVEAIGLCEWMEVGFNTFYTFRGVEAAWIYAQALRCLCGLTKAKCISVYPYQLGERNEEAIDSGAFWFYRKLGFRPGRADLLRLTRSEEQKIAFDAKYRTSSRTLRRLAAGHVFFELPGSQAGAWDKFSTRNIGLKINRCMAAKFHGESARIRPTASAWLARQLGEKVSSLTPHEQASFENFALVLSLVPSLSSWGREEKHALLKIIRAKSAANEMHYARLLQKHRLLREALLELGS
jgi:hypothetical protein